MQGGNSKTTARSLPSCGRSCVLSGYEDDLLELRRYLGKSVYFSNQPVLEELLLSLKGTVVANIHFQSKDLG